VTTPDTLTHPALSDPDTMPIGTVVAGRYRVERLLGKGGFGAVFAAVNANDGTRVALKILSRSVLDMVGGDARFRREAELARRLQHPNVVRVLDTGIDAAGALYIAFEYLEGRSVQDEIVRWGATPPARAARLVIEVLKALEEAHAVGIIHRDLKPANIYILGKADAPHHEQDRIKVLDFGIAKSVNPGTLAGLTQQGTSLGTPTYMAPEQISGGELTPSADLFALGVVLAELCIGRPLYGRDVSAMELFRERLMGQPLPVPDSVLSLPLGGVIQKATASHAKDRYQSAAEMRAALEAVMPTLTASSAVIGNTPPGLMGPSAASSAFAPTGAPMPTPAPHPGISVIPMPPAWGPPMMTPLAHPIAPPARSSGSVALVALLVVGVLCLVGLGAGAYAWTSSDDRAAARERRGDRDDRKARAADRDRDDDEEEADEEEPEEDDELDEEPSEEEEDEEIGDALEDPPPAHVVRVFNCSAVASLQKPTLSSHVQAIGWQVTGDLIYCAGNMVNFQCIGGDGQGVTAESGGQRGDAAVIRFPNAAEAKSFIESEEDNDEELTLAHAGAVVLRMSMPDADADRLMARICGA
jgi:serine/threonine protein kinase